MGKIVRDRGVVTEVQASRKSVFDPSSPSYMVSLSMGQIEGNYVYDRRYKSVRFETASSKALELNKGDTVLYVGMISTIDTLASNESLSLRSVQFEKVK